MEITVRILLIQLGAALVKLIKIFLIAVLLSGLVYCSVPIKDAFTGVPYTMKFDPLVQTDDYLSAEASVGCNRFFSREIGMIMEPPPADSIFDYSSTVAGTVNLKIEQNGKLVSKTIDLSQTGVARNSKDVWSITFDRFDPIGPIWCGSQGIEIEVSGLNFSTSEHSIMFYISRDRRP